MFSRPKADRVNPSSHMAETKKTVIVNGVHNYSAADAYIQPEPRIQQQLEGFKDLKLAFMVHWGLYNQLGILPSWGMVDAEAKPRVLLLWSLSH